MANRYRVHSFHETAIDVQAKTEDGAIVTAKMRYAIIELIPINARDQNTLTWREPMGTPVDIDFARSTFPVGGVVEVGDFALVEPPKTKGAA